MSLRQGFFKKMLNIKMPIQHLSKIILFWALNVIDWKKKFSQDQHSLSRQVQYRANAKSLIDVLSKLFTVLKSKNTKY